MLLGAGVFGIDATSVGTRLDRTRIGALGVRDVLKSIADAVLVGGGRGEVMVSLDVTPKRELLTLGEAVCAREGGGGGADGCAVSAPA